MRRLASIAALGVILAACSSAADDGATESTEAPPASSSVPSTTSSTLSETATAEGTCDDLKIALFDLRSDLDGAFAGAFEGEDEMSDSEALVALFEPVVSFYEDLATMSVNAPAEVDAQFVELSEWVAPLRAAIDARDPSAVEALDDGEMFAGVAEPAAVIDRWAAEHCDIDASVEPEALLSDVFSAALFAGLEDGLAGIGDELDGDFVVSDGQVEVYGDDPELDVLWDRCQTDDDEACDELYWSSFGLYELFAETCGGRAPYHPSAGGSCTDRMASDGPQSYGDDPYLDSLWDACTEDDTFSCDVLAGSAPVGSEYESFGLSCGGAVTGSDPRSCGSLDDPFGPGDDDSFDTLATGCLDGDAEACDTLWFDAPIGSVYESIGGACGALAERGQGCELVAELLGIPLG